MARLTCDVENYPNYFLIYFRNLDTGEFYYFYMYNNVYSSANIISDVRVLLANNLNITFNGINYDMPLIQMFLNGANNFELYMAGKDIITNRLMPWNFERKYKLTIPEWDHIDLINVAFGVASLKIYGARLGSQKLQELPVHFDSVLMGHEADEVRLYCGNDNLVTSDLFFELEGAIDLRVVMSEEYGVDLRSKSDAQIAEHVIKSEYKKATGNTLKAPKAQPSYKYFAPKFVSFTGEQLNELKDTCTTVDFNISDKGAVLMPKELNKQIKIAGKAFKMGIGGLHSVDKGGSYYSEDGYQLIDIDVTSYYPNIILNAGLEPVHIGELFTIIYRDILERRIIAKKAGDMVVSESLKIVINGLFGKFGSRYSAVYSPDLMFHTTVTGQLCLFMLIEQFAVADIQVVSANTDGITVRVHDSMREHLDNVVRWWEDTTGFNMEYAMYKSVHYRDVNNYIAVTMDGKAKGKGIFAGDGIRKNPANAIIRDSVMAYVKDGVDPYETIHHSTDVSKFLEVRKVAGGAVKDGEPLGASVRWYVSDATDTAINYAKNGNQVASSERGMPMMDLPTNGEFPSDLDLDWYIDKSVNVLKEIGAR